jgi:hypothetical protein
MLLSSLSFNKTTVNAPKPNGQFNLSEILQLLENTCFLMQYVYAIRMECWNIGGVKAETNYFNCKKLLQTHHPTISIGAKPLSSRIIFMRSGHRPTEDLF